MRYDDWDVILFPKDSHIPIQEFKTACYVAPDELNCQLPTLTCYVSSLPPSTPFRISVHSWATAAKPSAMIESRRKPSQKVVYAVKIIVDGAKVFRGFFDIASKWPQEIAHEKRSLSSIEQPSSQQKPCLEFPPFNIDTLLQSAWDARDATGRIRIVLSEQLVSKTASPGELDLGVTNDIVCFSFQHAPKDVLEQAGISWPIRNPLYLSDLRERDSSSSQTSPSFPWASRVRAQTQDVQMQSPLSQSSKGEFAKPQIPDNHSKSQSRLPPISNFQKPFVSARGHARTGTWDDSFASLGDCEDVSMDTWSTRRSMSNSTASLAMPDYLFTSSHPSTRAPPWASNLSEYEHSSGMGFGTRQSTKGKDTQVVVAIRDDQLEQIIDAISPPKRNRGRPPRFGNPIPEPVGRPATAHAYFPPKLGSASFAGRPSSAALARTSSYPDFNSALRNASNMRSPGRTNTHDSKNNQLFAYHPSVSSNKENRASSHSRLQTSYPHASRVPTPNPFAQRLPSYNSNVLMRDPSSGFPSFSRFDRANASFPPANFGKVSSAHTPPAMGNVKSRKEGLTADSSTIAHQGVRHDHSLLPPIDCEPSATRKSISNQEKLAHSIPALVEIIDVDAIDPNLEAEVPLDSAKLSPFKPNHKSGMSSIDSTGRLERQLFSALGEELGSFEENIDAAGMGPELAMALGRTTAHSDLSGSTVLNPSASEFEPTTKRKRQGTLGTERDHRPMTKKERAVLGDGEVSEDVVLRLRGD